MQQKMAENATPEPVESQVQESSELLLPNPEEPQEESSSVTLVPDFRASATTNTERICDTIDDTVLFTKQIQETSLLLPAVTETELQINTVLQERREESDAEAAKLSSLASDTYHTLLADDEMLNFYGYSYYTLDAITRLDCIAFSMTTYFSSYTGGAHPNNVQEAFNFSLEDGDRLSLEEVLQPKGTRALISGRIGILLHKAHIRAGLQGGRIGEIAIEAQEGDAQVYVILAVQVDKPISGIFPILALWFFSIHMTSLPMPQAW